MELALQTPEIVTLSSCQGLPLGGRGSHPESWPLALCLYSSFKIGDYSALRGICSLGRLRPCQRDKLQPRSPPIFPVEAGFRNNEVFLRGCTLFTAEAGCSRWHPYFFQKATFVLSCDEKCGLKKQSFPNHSTSVRAEDCSCFL